MHVHVSVWHVLCKVAQKSKGMDIMHYECKK